MLYTCGMRLLLQMSEAERQRICEVARSTDAGWVEHERVEIRDSRHHHEPRPV